MPRPAIPRHRGWLMVLAAGVGNTVTAGATIWALALYISSVPADFDVGRTAVFGAFSLGQVLGALLGPLLGSFIDRHGARRPLLLGCVTMPAALIGTSFASNLPEFYVGWALVSLSRSLLMPIPYNWLITRWFRGRTRQVAIGLITTGYALGGAVVLPIFALIESAHGWPAVMAASAALVLAFQGLPALLLMHDDPRKRGAEPIGVGEETTTGTPEGGFSPRQALLQPVFWLIASGMLFFTLGQATVNNLILDFFDSREVVGGAGLLAIAALLRALARPPLSLALGRVDRVFALFIAVTLSQALAVGLLVMTTAPASLWAWVLVWGVGGGFAPMVEPLLIMRAFGVRHYGAIAGFTSMTSFGGQVIGPLIGTILFDATGSYDIPFALYAGGFLASAVIWTAAAYLIRRPPFQAAAELAGLGRS